MFKRMFQLEMAGHFEIGLLLCWAKFSNFFQMSNVRPCLLSVNFRENVIEGKVRGWKEEREKKEIGRKKNRKEMERKQMEKNKK